MGDSVIRHKIGTKDVYLVWSPISNAPATYGLSKRQLYRFWRSEHGKGGLAELDRRFASGELRTLKEKIPTNRAGRDETQLTEEQIVDYYLVRKGRGKFPTGAET